jgi:multicomponent Na+:H+ antiporter subunit A
MGGASSLQAGVPMGLVTRAAFTALPLSALAIVVVTLVQLKLPLSGAIEWVPALGIRLAWRIDGLAALMLLMITGVGAAVFVYAGGYLAGHPGQRRLYVLLSLFMLAMIGCVTADDLYTLFLFWEATSVLSFLLVGFEHDRPASRKSAQQALLVTGTGGLALLAGLILIAQAMGTTTISTVVEQLPTTLPTPTLVAGVLLVLVGAFTKSAQFPFHFWLPNAMSAPTPVSAYLHSATMVKLGVFLLARLDAGLDTWPLWQWLLQAAGSITAAWGMVLALRERDLKRILAWSTVATLGTLVALVGIPGEDAAVAVGSLLLAHALYKAPLFFVAGNIDHGTGTRVIDRLGNLRLAMPWTAAAAALAGMSMAGIPLSFGFVVKSLIGDAKAAGDVLAFAPLANTVFSAIAVAVAGVAAVRVFWRHPGANETPAVHEGGAAMVLPPLALAAAGIVLGLFPVWAQPLVESAGVAMTPGTQPVLASLHLVMGPELASFAVTFAVGATVFVLWDALHRWIDALASRLAGFGLAAQYERLLGWIPRLAATATRWLQHGRSPAYLAVASAVAALAIGLPLALSGASLAWPRWESPSLGVAGAAALVILGALAATALRQRLAMLLGAGLVGYGSAVLFVFAGAPDVAFTQIVVETVFVIIIAAVLLALDRRGRPTSVAEPALRTGAAIIAVGFATVLTALMLAAVAVPFDDSLSRWFGQASLPAAQGRNVVNVILVDFRALDTLGEITVVMLSLLAAAPMLRMARARPPARSTPASGTRP